MVFSANDKAIQNQQHLTQIYRTETTQAKDVDKASPFLGKPLMKLKWKVETSKYWRHAFPIGSMYGIFTYIYHKIQPNVGIYTMH